MPTEVDPICAYYLGRFLRDRDRVLDVGCGRAAYRDLVPGQYVGMDLCERPFSPEDGKRFYVEGTSDKLPFSADTFDLIFARSAFYQFPNPDLALAEFRHALRPGGRVLLFDYNRRTQHRLQSAEGARRPCWTQWELRDRVEKAGFRAAEVLAAAPRPGGWVEHWMRLLHQEMFGTWAIVTGLK